MTLHKNARTCPKSRALMISRVLEAGRPVASVAAEFGVSRSTVYKWIRRSVRVGKGACRMGRASRGYCAIGWARTGWS